MIHGFIKLMWQEELTGQLNEIEPIQHARWCFDGKTFTIIKTVATVVSAAVKARNELAAGKAEQQAANARAAALEHEAAQARQKAGQERASSQRESFEARRKARLLESTALVRAAASGAGAGDPTVENILGGIGAEGEFRALTALFVGEEGARGLEMGADLKIFEGAQERRAGEAARRLSKGRAVAGLLSGGTKALSTAYEGGLFGTTADSGETLNSKYG